MSKKLLGIVIAGCLIIGMVSPSFALGFSLRDDFLPNDTMFSNQWALNNTGQRIRLKKGTEDIDMDVPEAWQFINDNIESSIRKTIVVAVLDSGVNYNHVDLKENILMENGKVKGYDFTFNDDDPEDNNGHGTMMAGIIAAVKDNLKGIAGISDYVKIMPVKILDDAGVGSLENLKKGIRYAADNGADIISMSLTGPYDASVSEVVDYAYSKGAIIVAASGSDNAEIGGNILKSPIDNEGNGKNAVIGVSAITSAGDRFSESNFGESIDLSAPGDSIITTHYRTNRSYAYASGTSLAAANVSGVASLLKSCFPDASNAEIIAALIDSAQALPSSVSGMGSGIVNAYNALVLLFEGEESNPIEPVEPVEPVEPKSKLIRMQDNPTVFFVKDNTRRGIPSLEVFKAWKFSFEDVEIVNSLSKIECYSAGKLLGFPKGYVIKGSTPTVFEVQDNDVIRGFSNPDAFLARGHKWEDIFTITDYEILNAYTFGAAIIQ